MPDTLTSANSAPAYPEELMPDTLDDDFVLEVHVIADIDRDLMPTACDTNDGCKATCASSCTST